MTRKKLPPPTLVRSSAAEYLTFVASSGSGGVEAVYADENVWLSQKMMAQLYDVDVRTISYHLKTIFSDSELQADAVIQDFRITASDGKTYSTKHYNLSATIAVGYKVNSACRTCELCFCVPRRWPPGDGPAWEARTPAACS